MSTASKVINGVSCISSDWQNVIRSSRTIANPYNEMIQAILHHPLKDFVSIAWIFSYHYQLAKQTKDLNIATDVALFETLEALNKLF